MSDGRSDTPSGKSASDDGRSAASSAVSDHGKNQKQLESVELTETMKKLLANNKDQEHLHRVLAVNEQYGDSGKNLADHVQNVLDVLIDSYPDKAL